MHKIWRLKPYNTDGAVIKDKCRIGTIYRTLTNLNVSVINSTAAVEGGGGTNECTHDMMLMTNGTLPPGSWHSEEDGGLNISQLN